MLRKLLKHELRATSRTMLPMLGLVLATAVGGNIAIYNLESTANALLNMLGILLMAAFVLSMLSAGIVAFVMMIRRFYKNLLRDEGYLMMTLPVSVHKQILSKTIVSVLWFALTGVTMALALGVMFFRLEIAQDLLSFVRALMSDMNIVWGDVPVQSKALALSLMAYLPVVLLLACATMCLDCYAAIAIGHSFSAHKGLFSFAAYFGMMFFWQMVGTCATGMLNVTGLDASVVGWLSRLPETTEVHLVMLGAMAVLLLSGALQYAITAYFLKNKLNLE